MSQAKPKSVSMPDLPDFYTEAPVLIAQNLKYYLEQGNCCPEVIDTIREDARRLIDDLELVKDIDGFKSDELRKRIEKVSFFPVSRVNSLLDGVGEQEKHDKVLECVNRMRALALRTLDIGKLPSKPEENPLYKLWIHKMARKGSLGMRFLEVMGREFAGRLFSAKELEDALGIEDNGSDSTRKVLYEISARSRGTDFELVVYRDGRDVRFFINPTPKGSEGAEDTDGADGAMTADKIEAEVFVKQVAPRENTHERRMARFLLDNLGEWLTTDDIAPRLGVKTEDIGRMIHGPLNRIAERCRGTQFKLEKRCWHDGIPRKKYRFIRRVASAKVR